MHKRIIQTGDTEFKILNTRSMCAYGSFETYAEAKRALHEAEIADVMARVEAA